MVFKYLAIALSVTLQAAPPAHADTTLVAVAANFAGAAEAISAAFHVETGHIAQITTGSTGKLYAQITEGAPFEVLLAADAKTPEKLPPIGALKHSQPHKFLPLFHHCYRLPNHDQPSRTIAKKCQPCPRTCVSYVPGLSISLG